MSDQIALDLIHDSFTFSQALQRGHLHLDSDEVQVLSGKILVKMGKYLEQGYLPAVAKANPDTTVDLVILSMEELGEEEGGV